MRPPLEEVNKEMASFECMKMRPHLEEVKKDADSV
jgi:hypothetical protein